MQKITVQIFENGNALGEGTATLKHAATEKDAVNEIFRHVRIDRQYRFLGSHGFIVPDGAVEDGTDYLLYNGGRA